MNDFFNRHIKARADDGSIKGGDYWQSPIETLVRGSGDCDDFVIAKYVSLRLLAIPPERLRLAVVKYHPEGDHAVLLFFPAGEEDPLVLDNLAFTHRGFSHYHILRLSERMELHRMTPLLGMNEKFWTVFAGGAREIKQGSSPLQKWRKFSTALMHSHRVLPHRQDESTNLLSKRH